MNAEFFNALDLLEKTKGIPKEYMLERVEAALISAYKREFKSDQGGQSNVRVLIDPDKKEIKIYQQKNIVEEVTDSVTEITLDEAHKISKRYALGGIAEVEIKPKNFRRLSAVTAKQVIIQGIREAENNNIIREYENKKEEIITALVTKTDEKNGNVIVDTGTSEAVLLKAEQIPNEVIKVDDRLKVFVTEVRKETRGPLVTLSRTHPGLVKRLFELEIPEIQSGIVLIKGISREAGSRSKMAVQSRDPDVDPVGACIGNRGMRIAGIGEELKGEKIDIVNYSENPEEYIKSALSPADVISVEMETERSAKVTVSADQLSLAIGKEGQNARLAAKLTGFKIDIKAE
jgi:transcription termination factor NusA